MAADSSTAAPSPTTPFTSRTPAPQAAPPPSLAQLPPHLLDIVPSTERLLSRLLLPAPGLQADGSTAPASQAGPEHKRHLDIQQLDQAANSVRMQIQKARTGVAGLPDMDRTVEDQKEEIEWLEARIAKMQDMMDKTRAGFAKKPEEFNTTTSASGDT
jgi:hypothetical protein